VEYGSAKNRLFLCSFYGGLKENLLQRFLRLERHPGPGPHTTVSLDIRCRRTEKRRHLTSSSNVTTSKKLPQIVPYGGTGSATPSATTYKCQLKPAMRGDHRLTAAEDAYADADTCLFSLGDNTDALEAAE
jgi:hypothetical protein